MPIFADLGDNTTRVLLAIIALASGIFGPLIASRLKGMLSKQDALQKSQNISAAAAVQVKDTLAVHTAATKEQLKGIQQTTDATYTLSNSVLGTALEAAAHAKRALSVALPTEDNIKAAELAEAASANHQKQQGIVDAVAVADAAKGEGK